MMQCFLTQILDLEDISCEAEADASAVQTMLLLISQCGFCPIPLVVWQTSMTTWEIYPSPSMSACLHALRCLAVEDLHVDRATCIIARDLDHAGLLTALYCDA
jgi:hypothetical protein